MSLCENKKLVYAEFLRINRLT